MAAHLCRSIERRWEACPRSGPIVCLRSSPIAACLCDRRGRDRLLHTAFVCIATISLSLQKPYRKPADCAGTLRPAVEDGGRGGGESSLKAACVHASVSRRATGVHERACKLVTSTTRNDDGEGEGKIRNGLGVSKYCMQYVLHLQRLMHADYCTIFLREAMRSSPSLLCNHLCSSSGGPAVDQAVWLSISHVCQNTSLYCYCYCYLLLPCIVGGISAAMTMTKTNSAACCIIIIIVLLVTTTTD